MLGCYCVVLAVILQFLFYFLFCGIFIHSLFVCIIYLYLIAFALYMYVMCVNTIKIINKQIYF